MRIQFKLKCTNIVPHESEEEIVYIHNKVNIKHITDKVETILKCKYPMVDSFQWEVLDIRLEEDGKLRD